MHVACVFFDHHGHQILPRLLFWTEGLRICTSEKSGCKIALHRISARWACSPLKQWAMQSAPAAKAIASGWNGLMPVQSSAVAGKACHLGHPADSIVHDDIGHRHMAPAGRKKGVYRVAMGGLEPVRMACPAVERRWQAHSGLSQQLHKPKLKPILPAASRSMLAVEIASAPLLRATMSEKDALFI